MSAASDFDFRKFATDYLKEFSPAIRRGSIGFLSIAKHSLLLHITSLATIFLDGFASESKEYYCKYPELLAVKNDYFDATLLKVHNNRLDLIPHLSKGITNKDQLVVFLALINLHKDYLLLDDTQHTLLIYPGSFDPMHCGHRAMIARLVQQSPRGTNLVVDLNSYQARKPHLAASYERRFAKLEHHILKSKLLDPYKVCAMDFRFGVKETEDHLRQTRLQAYMAGDVRLRWVIGGDKFMSEVERKNKEEMEGTVGRTLSRFLLENMSIYIVPRKGENMQHIKKLTDEFNATYSAEFIYIREGDYDGRPVSSTFIRKHANHEDAQLKQEAQRMEYVDLTRSYK